MEKKRSLRQSIMVRCTIFIVLLCILLSVANYFGYRSALYKMYEEYITDMLNFAASNIDVDDMKECLETGKKSDKFNQTQILFDNIKDTYRIDYIYVIIPQNTEPLDNIMNVIAGMSSYEKENVPENEVTLGGLTGDDYTVETATKYYNAADHPGEIVFFEEWADRWGSEYTGILSLYDSDGNYFAELCVDIETNEIHKEIRLNVITNMVIIIVLGAVFIIMFIAWSRKDITGPIQIIEEKVVGFASRSHGQTDPNELIIEMPDINTKNELQSLSEAIVKLSQDMRNYLINALSASNEAAEAHKKAKEMTEQANRDPLTGLLNKGATEEVISMLLSNESTGKESSALMMIDVDNFKGINDNFGHSSGDKVLETVGRIIHNSFKGKDVIGRVGGDEFMVLVRDIDSPVTEERLADRLEYTVMHAFESEKYADKVSLSIGISLYPRDGRTFEELYRKADKALYYVKNHGKAYYHTYNPETD